MYHFSGPRASIKPPEEFELSLPRLCRPLEIGVDVPGGDNAIPGPPPLIGVEVPGDRDRGGAYRWDAGLPANERGDVLIGRALAETFVLCVDCIVSVPAFVVIVREFEDATVVLVVETCADATRDEGETAETVELDLAWKVGLVRARNAEKKLAKNGRFVGIL